MHDVHAAPGPFATANRRVTVVAVVALVAAAAVLALGVWRTASVTTRLQHWIAASGAERHDRPLTARELDLPLETASRTTVTLRQLGQQHEVLLVHLWASWCPPCVEELPEVAAVARSLRGSRCAMAAISYDDDWAAAATLLDRASPRTGTGDATREGIWLRDRQGQGGDAAQMLRTSLGTDKLPETWLIEQGRVTARWVAGQKWTQPRLQQVLAALCPRDSGAASSRQAAP